MIEIIGRDENGKDRPVATFETYHDLFRCVRESDLQAFGYNPADRTDAPMWGADRNRYYWKLQYESCLPVATRCCYLAYEDDKLVTPDRLVGLYRAWWDERPRGRWYRFTWNRNAYGSFRCPRTTQERRWAVQVDEDEPPIRCARNNRNLPNAWDDFYGHSDRSWKTQSKRRHQWKERV
jgi:hypothetical protein